MSAPDEAREYPDVPPARVSSDPNHPDFHPHSYRIGVLVDGVREPKATFYDAQLNLYRLLGDGRSDRSNRQALRVDVFWLRPETRQERRARERWDAKHRGKVEGAPVRPPIPADALPPMEGASKEPPVTIHQQSGGQIAAPVITVGPDGKAHGIAEASRLVAAPGRRNVGLALAATALALGLGSGTR
jgi:hypothetical protein